MSTRNWQLGKTPGTPRWVIERGRLSMTNEMIETHHSVVAGQAGYDVSWRGRENPRLTIDQKSMTRKN
jgi:hypothetical protein